MQNYKNYIDIKLIFESFKIWTRSTL